MIKEATLSVGSAQKADPKEGSEPGRAVANSQEGDELKENVSLEDAVPTISAIHSKHESEEVEGGSRSTNSASEEEEELQTDLAEDPQEQTSLRLSDTIEVHHSRLSYDRFYPGRILGNTFKVSSKSDKPVQLLLDADLFDTDPLVVQNHFVDYFEVPTFE